MDLSIFSTTDIFLASFIIIGFLFLVVYERVSPFCLKEVDSDLTFAAIREDDKEFFYLPKSDWESLSWSEAKNILREVKSKGHQMPFYHKSSRINTNIVFVFDTETSRDYWESVIENKIRNAKIRADKTTKKKILAKIQ